MSTTRFLGIICFSASLYAQFSSGPETSVSGEIRAHGNTGLSDLLVEVYDGRTNCVIQRAPVNEGRFELEHIPIGAYSVRLVTAPGAVPLVEQYQQFGPGSTTLVLEVPERAANKPISGLVSVRELEHPIPKKALKEAYEAEQFAQAHDYTKAIAKFEKAIQIDPAYRDAHVNLGVQYARTGRTADARAQFQRALEIGPPAAIIYVDLALAELSSGQRQEAATLARKALDLDPANSGAQRVLQAATPR